MFTPFLVAAAVISLVGLSGIFHLYCDIRDEMSEKRERHARRHARK